MTELPKSFAQFAGQVLFPRTLTDLTSTAQCPACFRALSSTVCANCALDLNHPAAADLAHLSNEAADIIESRTELIGRMRFETKALAERIAAERAEAARAAAAASAPAFAPPTLAPPAFAPPTGAAPALAAAAAPTTLAPPTPRAEFAPPTTPPIAPPAPPAPSNPAAAQAPTPRRRGSSVQVLVLIGGITLLSAAAIAFLVYAFINYGIEWRSAIIATFTVATFVIASLLRRRDFASTAEGIAVFAVVLVYLDAFAVRANDLFGAASAQPQVYWGATLLVSAVAFIAWHRMSRLRVASVAGFAAVAPGAGLLAYGLSDGLSDTATRVFIAFAVTAAIAVLHPLAGRRPTETVPGHTGTPERIVLLTIAAIALVAAVATSNAVLDTSFWAATVCLLVVAAIAALHVVVIARSTLQSRTAVAFGRIIASVGAVAAAASFAPPVLREASSEFALIAPALAAVIVTLALDVLARRTGNDRLATTARAARIAALVVAALALLTPVALTAFVALSTAARAVTTDSWSVGATQRIVVDIPENGFALIALAATTVLFVAFSAAAGRLRQRASTALALALVVVILAVPLLTVLTPVAGAWLAIGAAAVAVTAIALRSSRVELSRPRRAIILVIGGVATALGYLTSWASLDTWLAGSLIAIAVLLAARLVVETTAAGARAVLLGVAATVGLIAAGALAQQYDIGSDLQTIVADASRFVGILAIALLAVAALPRFTTLSTADRRTLFWMTLPVVLASQVLTLAIVPNVSGELLLAEPVTGLIVATVVLGVLLAWVAPRGAAALPLERITSAAVVAPAVYGVLDAATRAFALPTVAAAIAATVAMLLVAASALVAAIARPAGVPRWAFEIGVGILAVLALAQTTGVGGDREWLNLLLAAVTALLVAISPDGLFASTSARRFIGWASLALGTLGLWRALGTPDGGPIEPYVLPVAGALLLIALFVWRAARAAGASAAAPFIALGGLLVGILPIAVTGATGAVERAIIVGAVSAALLLGASLARGSERVRPYLDAAAVAGALGVIVVTSGRALTLLQTAPTSGPDVRLDLWLGGALIALFAAAFGQAALNTAGRPALRSAIGQALGVAALAMVLVFGGASLAPTDHGFARALALILLFAVVHAVALSIDRGPLRAVLGWTSLAFTVGALTLAVTSGALTSTEMGAIVTITALVSSAIALLVTVRGWSTAPRVRREAGLAALGIVSVFLAVTSNNDLAWLVLVLAAVTTLILAVAPDGLFAAEGNRKQLGWLALALATAGLWWRLRSDDLDAIELYVLPLAGTLLLIALLAWRARARTTDADASLTRSTAAPFIALGGLLVAVLPIALTGATGAIERAVAIGLVSAALLLVGSLVVGRAALRPYLDVAAVAGAVGVLVTAIGRAWFLRVDDSVPDARLDAWLGAALVVLIAAAFGQAIERTGDARRVRSLVSQGLGILALTVVFLFEVTSVSSGGIGQLRALAVVLLFSAVHVIAVAVDRTPLTRLLGWIAFGYAAVTAVTGIALGALDPVELGSAPVAVALLATGVIHLSRTPAARSWPTLGPGMLLLFVPSLLLTIDDKPLWRLIAIAVVGIGAVVVGLVGRLQAPFLIGVIVTVVHGIATFSPQIREVYEAAGWLVWIIVGALGGTLLTVLAARYEKSLSSAKTTIRRVAELR